MISPKANNREKTGRRLFGNRGRPLFPFSPGFGFFWIRWRREGRFACQWPSTRRSIRAVGAGDPVPRQRPQRRSLRSPELHRRPRTAISLKRSRRRRRHHHRAATSRCTNQAARAGRDAPRRNRGHHRQGIKNASSPAGNVGERARRSLRK